METWLARLLAVPEQLLLRLRTLAAALENFVPPFPADMLILFDGMLIGHAGAPIYLPALVVWLGNVAGALTV